MCVREKERELERRSVCERESERERARVERKRERESWREGVCVRKKERDCSSKKKVVSNVPSP